MLAEIDDLVWTEKQVRGALVDAYRTLNAIAGRIGPARLKAAWPEHMMEPGDFVQQTLNKTFKGRRIRLSPTARDISRMELVFGLRNPAGPADNWLSGALLAYPDHRHVLMASVLADIRGQSTKDLALQEGYSLATFKRYRAFACQVIIDRLRRGQIEPW